MLEHGHTSFMNVRKRTGIYERLTVSYPFHET
jgi:hypothetical protein